MSERDAFGPNLRRIRVQRGLSLEQIAESTKVSVTLWKGLERNDFSKWPNGIYARSYVREYANAIGVDPEITVNDFCRWFPQGDRRMAAQIRGQAQIVGHDNLQWRDRDHVPPKIARHGDRRGAAAAAAAAAAAPKPAHWTDAFTQMFVRLRRAVGRA
jgi:transcriptional regulator with XRE-family HTH domain